MKKVLWGFILLALAMLIPFPALAQVSVQMSIPLPPPLVFASPPAVVVMPDTSGVYVVPDVQAEMFFSNGWWWRLWEGRWYRSSFHDRGWAYYNSVPRFYYDVDPGWREHYNNHTWNGHAWNYERIPNQQLRQNWKSWQTNHHWEGQRAWGVQGYQPRSQHQRQELRQQREAHYQQRPEVRQHQQPQAQSSHGKQPQQPQGHQPQPQQHQAQGQQPQKQPQHPQGQQQPQKSQGQQKPQGQQQPQKQGQPQRQGEAQHQQPQGKSEGGDTSHKR